MDLDRSVNHIMQHARAKKLDQRNLDARVVAAIQLPGCVQRHQASGIDFRRRVGNPVLHRLLFRERLAKRLPLERVGTHHFETALRGANPTHAVLNSAWAEPGLGQLKALS